MQCRQIKRDERKCIAERRAFKRAVIRAARKLATGDAEATAILNFIVPRLGLRQPLPRYEVGYLDKPIGLAREEMLLLAPVRASDSWMLEADAAAQQFSGAYHAETVYGTYFRGTRTVYMPMDWNLKLEVCAVIFLHECTHVYDHLSRNRPLTRWRSELHARRVEYRLLSKCHPAVAIAHEDIEADIAKRLVAGSRLGSWEPSSTQVGHAELEELFGGALTFSDRHFCRGALGRMMVQRYLLANRGAVSDEMRRLSILG